MTSVWRPLAGATAAAVGLGAGAAAYATWVEPRWFVLRRGDVPCLPAGASALRVLHLSDLHLVPDQRRKRDWVHALEDLEPDLVVHTGDHLAAMDAVPAALDTYGGLLDRPGAFVLGSNDYYPPTRKNPLRYFNDSHRKGAELTPEVLPTQDLVDGLTGRGWEDLTHRRVRLDVAGLDLELVGTDDAHLERDDYASVSAPAAADADLTIGVTHAPYRRVLDPMAADGARLLIAGHTHGGQLRVPGHGALVTNCDLDTSRARGLSRWWPGAGARPSSQAPTDAAWLHVSAGLGGNPYTPFRFCCRPEATLLTLTPASP
ncbi:putative secreted protein [Serinicoccus hydrothermalis]|uniref:Putative secreted protein n=1 Tax=Serinicoccus hydrothermalis TaxID=1758689 RepID=A0A1B1NBV4_9MICO|nr:metallophosphoesterase [Serinicoccus hydrothermalis]ANS78906.1 putative secreted protein [Serinicoccus hydrothermalis]